VSSTMNRIVKSRVVRSRACTRQPLLFTHEELLQLLNDDLRRERKAVYAYLVYSDKLRNAGRTALANRLEERGQIERDHAARLEQLIRDFGGAVNATVDELNAILSADRVAQPAWKEVTVQCLHDRACQLRTAGFPGFAKRMMRIVAEKKRLADLCELLGEQA
jgi:rubrerythrin